MSLEYKVTIRIESAEGFAISVVMENCPREALLKMSNIAPALALMEEICGISNQTD